MNQRDRAPSGCGAPFCDSNKMTNNPPNREALLARLLPGDIFHAKSIQNVSLICLTVSVTENRIQARTVTTQIDIDFDRKRGEGEYYEKCHLCIIDSITPLPIDTHNTILSLDRKFRLEFNEERFKLTPSERQALSFIDAHYKENPLPDMRQV